ncbi:hypothetical protein DM860_003664 [Cuscuta australis]|uniref:Uncharacterized protein n=1 Tax=Cuscuta australis TaxID=267555 RepID=A0A328DGH5_9ASTE|nr:hypothetical protein DM860_003664 [Cuscuta australis]
MLRYPVWVSGFIMLSLITTPPVHCKKYVTVSLLPCKLSSPENLSGAVPCKGGAVEGAESCAAAEETRRWRVVILHDRVDSSINCTTLKALYGCGVKTNLHNEKAKMSSFRNANVAKFKIFNQYTSHI